MIEDFKCLDSFNRRAFLSGSANGIGLTALGGLFANDLKGVSPINHIAKAKRIIYLFQSGGPSQIDLFDPKDNLEKQRGKELPESVRMGQRMGDGSSPPPEGGAPFSIMDLHLLSINYVPF